MRHNKRTCAFSEYKNQYWRSIVRRTKKQLHYYINKCFTIVISYQCTFTETIIKVELLHYVLLELHQKEIHRNVSGEKIYYNNHLQWNVNIETMPEKNK